VIVGDVRSGSANKSQRRSAKAWPPFARSRLLGLGIRSSCLIARDCHRTGVLSVFSRSRLEPARGESDDCRRIRMKTRVWTSTWAYRATRG